MKKFFLSTLICFFGIAAFGQKYCLEVRNETNCTVFFRIVGDDPCGCTETYTSCVYSLVAGGTMNIASSVTLGCDFPTGSAKTLNALYAFNDPACLSGTMVRVGEPTCGYAQLDSYLGLNPAPGCGRCGGINVEWKTDGIPCNTDCARVRFFH